MELLLMVACMSLFGVAVTCAAFGAAAHPEQDVPAAQPAAEPARPIPPPRFFAEPVATPVTRPQVPIEALLLQIEGHVRLEQAAAESFLESPTSVLLHSRTLSPLVN